METSSSCPHSDVYVCSGMYVYFGLYTINTIQLLLINIKSVIQLFMGLSVKGSFNILDYQQYLTMCVCIFIQINASIY